MKIDIVKPGLVLLCVFFAVMWLTKSCDKPVTKPDDGVAWRDSVQVLKNTLILKDSLISQIQTRRGTEIKKAKQDSSRLSIENRRLSVGYSRSKKQIQELQDSTGRISEFVAVTDSLLNAKDSLYYREVGHRIALEQLHRFEISQMAQKNVIHVQLSDEYKARADQLTNQNERLSKRLERKRKFNNVLLGISGGLLTAVGVMALTN